MTTFRTILSASALLACATTATVAQEVGPELRQLAIDTCSGDAMRLCPTALFSEQAVVSCMSTKRNDLSRTCRATYDRVARVLRQ